MKKLGIVFIIFAFAFVGCNEDDSISKRDKEAAKQEKEQVAEPSTEPQTATVYYEPAPLSDDGNSYWFVVVMTKDGVTKYNNVLKQNHRWFSVIEAKGAFDKDVFILNVVQVSRETYEEDKN
jgi:hypothetical protein